MLTSKPTFFLKSSVCAAATMLMLANVVQAQQSPSPIIVLSQTNLIEDAGDSQRVNFSGKLRMLSQRIPAAACNLNAGVVRAESAAVLTRALAELDLILIALEFGDSDLGIIGPEERRRTVHAIQHVRDAFVPLQTVVNEAVGGVPDSNAMQVLADNNMGLLAVAQALVTEVSSEYANQAVLLQSDIIAIDLAGRQRMLTQQISKEICFIMSGINVESSRQALTAAIVAFENTLAALRGGMEAVNLPAAPTPEIAQGLATVHDDWLVVKAHIDGIEGDLILSTEERAAIFLGLNQTLIDMNDVVTMYSEASKLGL